MLRLMLVLSAVALGLAACGSKDKAEQAAKDAANAAANTADSAANAAANAGDSAANAAENTADQGKSLGKSGEGPAKGQSGKPNIKLNVQKVEFAGCARLIKVSKPQGCMVVKSGAQTYDIDSARPLPHPNTPIAGTGIYLPNQQGTCMVGKPLTGVKWAYTGKSCAKGKGKGHG